MANEAIANKQIAKLRETELALTSAVLMATVAASCIMVYYTITAIQKEFNTPPIKVGALALVTISSLVGCICLIKWYRLKQDPDVIRAYRDADELVRRIEEGELVDAD